MSSVPVEGLPAAARAAWLELRDELRQILGDNLVAVWAHGGTAAAGDDPHPADLDTYVILAHAPSSEATTRIEAAQEAIAHERGVEWDTWYVLEADARRADQPRHAYREGSRDTTWAIHRAHWLDGRYVALHGPSPDEVVAAPTWIDLVRELDRELEHIERHVLEGDTDPYEATYAMLNGSRILHAVETGSVTLSKAAAGRWALEHVPARWHQALHAARRAYVGEATADDVVLLAAEMGPFVAYVRERLPATDGRPADAVPRWSGF